MVKPNAMNTQQRSTKPKRRTKEREKKKEIPINRIVKKNKNTIERNTQKSAHYTVTMRYTEFDVYRKSNVKKKSK